MHNDDAALHVLPGFQGADQDDQVSSRAEDGTKGLDCRDLGETFPALTPACGRPSPTGVLAGLAGTELGGEGKIELPKTCFETEATCFKAEF